MSKRFFLATIVMLTILVVAGVALVSGQGSESLELTQELAGSIFNRIEVTTDTGTENRALLNLSAKGAPGSALMEVVGGAIPAPVPSNLCPDGTDLELTFVNGGIVETFNDHSMLFYVIDTSPDAKNALCVDFHGPSTGVFDYVITGGAGRFTGATGHATVEVTSWPVTAELAAEVGTIRGEVQLP